MGGYAYRVQGSAPRKAVEPVAKRGVLADRRAGLPLQLMDDRRPGSVTDSSKKVEPTPRNDDGPLSKEEIEAKRQIVDQRIDAAKKTCKDSLELRAALEQIKADLGLKQIEVVNEGTPAVKVRYQINPWFENPLGNNQIAHRMTGRTLFPVTKVDWGSQNLTIDTVTAEVGSYMKACPLAPDHEPGSDSSVDSAQDRLMGQLINAGKKDFSNNSKYIKGHLLNDNVGGPGYAFNLFPITADANAKHLSYVEKYIKAQISAGAIIDYYVEVAHQNPQQCGSQYAIDADFKIQWARRSITGKWLTTHDATVQSRAYVTGAEPIDAENAYADQYDVINHDKKTPHAKLDPDQKILPGVKSATKVKKKIASFTRDKTLAWNQKSSAGANKVYLLTKHRVNFGGGNVRYIALRKSDLPAGLNRGSRIAFKDNKGRKEALVLKVDMSGPWKRVYF